MLWWKFSLLLFTGFSLSAPVDPCKRALNELNESKLLFALPDDRLEKSLESWSSDLLIRMALEIRGPYLGYCKTNKKLEPRLEAIETAYLKKLGIQSVEGKERHLLFRALLTLKEDFEKLEQRLKQSKQKVQKLDDLKGIYPQVEAREGVVFVTESGADISGLMGFVKEVCSKTKTPCRFWDTDTLFKVLITDTSGIAAFVPELGILVLSKELLNLNVLSKLVILHELTHVAKVAAWNRERIDWLEKWKSFSGWKEHKGKWSASIQKEKRTECDVLCELSANSPYSLLPDDLVWGMRGKKKLDGFLFEKSYHASIERGIAEDLADAAAAYWVSPHRFCVKGKEFAPQKKKWLEENLFLGSQACAGT